MEKHSSFFFSEKIQGEMGTTEVNREEIQTDILEGCGSNLQAAKYPPYFLKMILSAGALYEI